MDEIIPKPANMEVIKEVLEEMIDFKQKPPH